MGTLSQILLLFSVQELDASRLLLSVLLEETRSTARCGTVSVRKAVCDLRKRRFPSVFCTKPMSLEQRGGRQDGPAQHPEGPRSPDSTRSQGCFRACGVSL